MTTTHDELPLHTSKPSRQTTANRLFAVVHSCAILTLLYHHSVSLLNSTTATSFFITLTFLVSDSILAFMFTTTQSFRMRPIYRDEFPENMKRVVQELDVPALDVFICTADPYKEPPMNVVNTALSVMAYDYPTEKLSVYVSDDGGSALTLFSFMEAAKFASHWLPFCRKNKIVECNPEAYFATDHSRFYEAEKTKDVYQGVKVRVNNVIEIGTVGPEHVTGEREIQAFSKWTDKFTKQDHPTVIQVVLDSSKDKDVSDHLMPNLIYVSREKRRTSLHHFKAGALNALLRVSATMTNAPIILTLDCDTYSNDSQTPHRALCYLSSDPKVGFVQFPQRFHGINKNDIYACEHKRLYKINPVGMDGLLGPNYLGTGTFFSRRAHLLPPEIPQLCPTNVVSNPIQSPEVTELAHRVAACSYEISTNWGSKIGVRYGSLVEDFFTGYRMHCEGWKSIFCHPTRAAFYGDAPMNLIDVLNQNKRWAIGDLEVAFSKYSPITYGTCVMGPLMGLSYAHYAFWPIWSIPLTTYAFLPQLALFNGLTTFPKVSEPWFLLYVFLFLGAYIQDLLDFVLAGGTVQTWWNDQRMWLIRGLSSFLFGTVEFFLKSLGIASHGFNVTSKVLDDDQSKRYEQGTIEFGVLSAMFVPLTMAAIVNLAAFSWGNVEVFRGKCSIEGVFVQMFIAGFGTVNSKPIYEAIISRKDKGRIPKKTAVVSTSLAFALFAAAHVLLDNSKDRDITGHLMSNLIYVSREKSRTSPHHFKAGALNALLRVSATMTNAPIVLTLDCDMYSNNPDTALRTLCYLSDPKLRSKVGYVQFPQRFQGINKTDIYASEFRHLFIINPCGFDGLLGPNYVGTGCFFSRRAFFGGPSELLPPEIPQLHPNHVVDKPLQNPEVLELANHVASCNYENNTTWGYKMGVRYGSLVEDYFTGYILLCEGWNAIFCNPERAAFLGDAPINLLDALNQSKRWAVGLLEVCFSKYSPVTYGVRAMGPLMGFGFAYGFWALWAIPITTYAFVPQLALLNGITLFPKVSDPWFLLYVFVVLGAYGEELVDFVLSGGTFLKWWNNQRMWIIRGLSSFAFGFVEYFLKSLGISTHGFNVTSKVLDEDQSKRYEQGMMEFGVSSPFFVPLTVAAIVNLAAFAWGHVEIFRGGGSFEGLFLQMFIAGFGIVNCIPIYEAMISRNDKGKIPTKTSLVSTILAFVLYAAAYITLRN